MFLVKVNLVDVVGAVVVDLKVGYLVKCFFLFVFQF